MCYNNFIMSSEWDKKLIAWRERRKQIYDDRESGMSYNQIGRKHDISATSVSRILDRYEKEIEKSSR